MTDLFQAADYKKHKQQAAIVTQYSSDFNFHANAENITRVRTPNAQADTLLFVAQWEQSIKRFCTGPIQRYIKFRDASDVNNPDALNAINQFEADFKLRDIEDACLRIGQELRNLFNDPNQLQREVRRSLDAYLDLVDRASQSEVFLRKAIADTSSSVFNTQLSLQGQLNTLINLHEISLNNSTSIQWREEFEAINSQREDLFHSAAQSIIKHFQKPSDLYKDEDGDTIRKTIKELLDSEPVVEIILQDNSIRNQRRLLDLNRGVHYESISFYAFLQSATEIRLDFGWYERDLDSQNELVTITQSINIPVSQENNGISQHMADTPTKENSGLANQPHNTSRVTPSLPTSSNQTASLLNWLLGMIMSLLMVLIGMLLIQKSNHEQLHARLINRINILLKPFARKENLLAWCQCIIAGWVLISGLFTWQPWTLLTAFFAVGSALLQLNLAVTKRFMLRLEPMTLWIGIAAIILGLINLFMLII